MEQNLWGNRLNGFSWRIDVKTKARHIKQLNEPTAILEMQLSTCSKGSSKVKYFMVSYLDITMSKLALPAHSFYLTIPLFWLQGSML